MLYPMAQHRATQGRKGEPPGIGDEAGWDEDGTGMWASKSDEGRQSGRETRNYAGEPFFVARQMANALCSNKLLATMKCTGWAMASLRSGAYVSTEAQLRASGRGEWESGRHFSGRIVEIRPKTAVFLGKVQEKWKKVKYFQEKFVSSKKVRIFAVPFGNEVFRQEKTKIIDNTERDNEVKKLKKRL